MRAVVTRVKNANVSVEGKIVGEIGHGFLVLLGVSVDDTIEQVKKIADKICKMRVFADEKHPINADLKTVGGELLVVSQFTLYADCKKGNRPSFFKAAPSEIAVPLYESFVGICKSNGFHVEQGVFGADMEVASVNDGPVTIFLDTSEL